MDAQFSVPDEERTAAREIERHGAARHAEGTRRPELHAAVYALQPGRQMVDGHVHDAAFLGDVEK